MMAVGPAQDPFTQNPTQRAGHQGADEEAADLQQRYDLMAQRYRALEVAHSIELTLSRVAASGDGLSGILGACHDLTGKPVAVFDHQERLIARVPREGSADVEVPPVAVLLAQRGLDALIGASHPGAESPTGGARKLQIVKARPLEGIAHRYLIAPVNHAGTERGWLAVAESPSRLRPVDELIARRTAEHVGRELSHLEQVATATWNARSALTRQLIGGTSDADDLRRSGQYLGVDTRSLRVLSYVRSRSDGEGFIDDAVLAKEVERRLEVDVLSNRGSEGVVLLIGAPDGASPVAVVRRAKAALEDICRREFFELPLVAGVSAVTEPSGLRRAYREAREVAGCIDRFATRSSTRVLSVDDLGPARLFLANGDVSSVRRYVDDVLGALLTGSASTGDLLATLQTYFDTGRSVRICASQLQLHQNTVRLRLARVRSLTGLDVAADANDQLSVQTALLVLRLQGHPSLPKFERTREDGR